MYDGPEGLAGKGYAATFAIIAALVLFGVLTWTFL